MNMMRHTRESIYNTSLRRSTEPFLNRLRSLVALTDKEEQFVEALSSDFHSFPPGTQIFCKADAAVRPWIVASGWACRFRTLPDGRRQIISFFLPGETIGVLDLQHPAAQCAIAAITDLELLSATSLVEALNHVDGAMPNIIEAFRKEPIQRRAQQLDHILRLGRLTALERTTHLLLELDDRMANAGLAHNDRFPLPLTQLQLGEALGLSLVHVNRTIQQLRRDGLIELKSGLVSLLDRARMEVLCHYTKIVL
jgi:CRP-like cAMP-binding protein